MLSDKDLEGGNESSDSLEEVKAQSEYDSSNGEQKTKGTGIFSCCCKSKKVEEDVKEREYIPQVCKCCALLTFTGKGTKEYKV